VTSDFNIGASNKVKEFSMKLLVCSFLVIFLLSSTGNIGRANSARREITVERGAEGEKISVRTGLVDYLFYEKGGTLRSVFLHFASYGSKQAELVTGTTTDPKTLKRSFLKGAQFPGQLSMGEESDGQVDYELAELTREKGEEKLFLRFEGKWQGLEISKEYTIYNRPNYTFDLVVGIKNETGEPLASESLDLYLGTRREREDQGNIRYLSDPSVQYIFDGEVNNGVLASGSYNRFGGAGFVGSDLVFFLKNDAREDGDKAKITPFYSDGSLGVHLLGKEVGAGDEVKRPFTLYAGRRRHVMMSEAGLAKIDEIGIFSQLLVPVINFLNRLYKLTGNYGWAIILFTILIRVLLYPLMRNMYHSMAKMQELQPKIKEIQEKYEDDKEQQQKEMMKIYKEEGVNPLGGCLPMFIQLPILILLWRAILYSAEAIHLSPGFLWLNDLSVHDPYYILVALTVGIMILQQQLMQTPGAGGGGGGQNKFIGLIFPLFMGVMLHNFPAGLWLYYFLTTLFQVGQQYFINWEMKKSEATEEGGDA